MDCALKVLRLIADERDNPIQWARDVLWSLPSVLNAAHTIVMNGLSWGTTPATHSPRPAKDLTNFRDATPLHDKMSLACLTNFSSLSAGIVRQSVRNFMLIAMWTPIHTSVVPRQAFAHASLNPRVAQSNVIFVNKRLLNSSVPTIPMIGSLRNTPWPTTLCWTKIG